MNLTSTQAVRYTQVTDAGLKDLAALKNPHHARSLHGTPVTDAGLKELAALKNLTTLNLIDTEVTDAGLKDLAGLKNLTTLCLYATPVTDAGLKELAAHQEPSRGRYQPGQRRGDGRGSEGAGRTQEPHLAGPAQHAR